MGIPNTSIVEILVQGLCLGQRWMNVFQYLIANPVGDTEPVALAAAWWNDVKASYRAMVVSTASSAFMSVVVRDLSVPTGAYAEWPIPGGEHAGNRTTSELGDNMPPFTAFAVRLTVGSRVTRPGQKRFPFLNEVDNGAGLLVGDMGTLAASWAAIIAHEMTLGVPALLTVLTPVICRKDAAGLVTAHQPVTGYIVNPYITSQNTRKIGRGA